MWWNINNRLPLILKYENSPLRFYNLDLFFVSEACIGHNCYPDFNGYVVISDPKVATCLHGAFSWYIKESFYPHIFGITYGSSFIAFSLDLFPHVVFIGTYTKPENSQYFNPIKFSELSAYIIDCPERNKTIYLGGDLNSRPADLNDIRPDSVWKYAENVDIISNTHGRSYFPDLCNSANVMPVNHLKYKGSYFAGDFTYQKADMKSQIDFIITDHEGRNLINEFCIIQSNWFLSDHKPIYLKISINMIAPAISLYKRVIELNFDISKPHVVVKRYKGLYN